MEGVDEAGVVEDVAGYVTGIGITEITEEVDVCWEDC